MSAQIGKTLRTISSELRRFKQTRIDGLKLQVAGALSYRGGGKNSLNRDRRLIRKLAALKMYRWIDRYILHKNMKRELRARSSQEQLD